MKKKSRKTTQQSLRNEILDSLLAEVPFDGWTEAAYSAALKKTGASSAEAERLFPNGIRDAVELFGNVTDEAMQKRIETERGFDRMRMRDKITFAVRARLGVLAPHRESMRRLMMWYALPTHAPMGFKRISKTVDLIWRAAGDTSTDYNFYTKRILLAGVMKTTMLFWLSDDSPSHEATWEFLDRRIADVMKLGKGIGLLKEFKPSEIFEMAEKRVRKFVG